MSDARTVEYREALRFAVEDARANGDPAVSLRSPEGRVVMGVALAEKVVADMADLGPPIYHVNPPKRCDIGDAPIEDEFYDGRLVTGTVWANMCPRCWATFGTGQLGTGHAQHYRARMANGVKRFIKIGG